MTLTNYDLIYSIIQTIRSTLNERNITQEQLGQLCRDKNISISQGTISNMLKKPFSCKLETLLKVCEGLELNLQELITELSAVPKLMIQESSKLISDPKNPLYEGYTGDYFVYFLNTMKEKDTEFIKGKLHVGSEEKTDPCPATLTIDSGDISREGTPFIKTYEGTFILSQHQCIFCNLLSDKNGDAWSLVFHYRGLNNNDFQCAIGCASTTSSGTDRSPTIHRACISRREIPTESLRYLRGLLFLANENIYIKPEQIKSFLHTEDVDPIFERNIDLMLSNPETYYALPKNALKSSLSNKTYTEMISLFIQYSGMGTTHKVPREVDEFLFSIL